MKYKRIIIRLVEEMREEEEKEFLKMLYTITIRHMRQRKQ